MKKILILFGVMAMPALAFATGNVSGILDSISGFLSTIVTLLITLAVIYFIWGVIKYVIADSNEDRSQGRQMMIYGIIGIFVIVALWGIIDVLGSTFDISRGGSVPSPEVPTN